MIIHLQLAVLLACAVTIFMAVVPTTAMLTRQRTARERSELGGLFVALQEPAAMRAVPLPRQPLPAPLKPADVSEMPLPTLLALLPDDHTRQLAANVAIVLQRNLPSLVNTFFHTACKELVDEYRRPTRQSAPILIHEACLLRNDIPVAPSTSMRAGIPPDTRVSSSTMTVVLAVHNCDAAAFRWVLVNALLPPGDNKLSDRRILMLLLDSTFRVDCAPIAEDLLHRFSTLGVNGDAYYRPIIHAVRHDGDEPNRVLTNVLLTSAQLDVNAVQRRPIAADEVELATGVATLLYMPIASNVEGTTALATAAYKSHPILFRTLLKHGAKPWAEAGIAWRTALLGGHVSIMEAFVLNVPADASNALIRASVRSMALGITPLDQGLFKWLLECRKLSIEEERELLVQAVNTGNVDIVRILTGHTEAQAAH